MFQKRIHETIQEGPGMHSFIKELAILYSIAEKHNQHLNEILENFKLLDGH